MEDSDDVNVRGCLDVLLDMLRVTVVLLKGSASSRTFLLEMIGVPPLGANGVKALMPHQLFVCSNDRCAFRKQSSIDTKIVRMHPI